MQLPVPQSSYAHHGGAPAPRATDAAKHHDDDDLSPSTSPSAFGVIAGVLIPGRGEPVEDGALVVDEKGVIDWVGPEHEIPGKYSSLTFHRVPVLMP